MKRITSLLLVSAMLLSMIGSAFAVTPPPEPSPQTAPMSLLQLQDSLKGNGISGTAIGNSVTNKMLGLHTVYKNISPDQIKQFSAFNVRLNAYVDTRDYSSFVGSSGVSANDIKTLVKGFAQVMTFVTDQYKTNHLFGDVIADDKDNKILSAVDAAATKFYVPVDPDKVIPMNGAAYDILNKISHNTMTKNALGGVILDFKKEMRKLVKEQMTAGSLNFPSVFVKNTANGFLNDPHAINALTKTALSRIFTNADPRTQLYLLKQGLKSYGLLTETGGVVDTSANAITLSNHFGIPVTIGGVVDESSIAIKLVEAAFDLMNAVDGNYDTAATVANVNLSGVLDVKLVDIATQTIVIASPNDQINFDKNNTKVVFKVKPDPTANGSIENLSLVQNTDLTSWLDWSVYTGPLDAQVNAKAYFNISYNSVNNTISVSPSSLLNQDSRFVLKLYRKVNATAGNLPAPTNRDEIKDLFIEIPMTYTRSNPTPTPGPGPGPGPGPSYPTPTPTPVPGLVTVITMPENYDFGSTLVTNNNQERGTFPVGTTVKIVATPKTGYDFVSWKIGDTVVSTTAEYTFVLNVDTTLVAYFIDKLDKVNHNWYLRGYPDGSFDAERPLSRAEMAMILYRISTNKDRLNTEPKAVFPDTKPESWYTKAITFLYDQGIFVGDDQGNFRPDDAITRSEIATMVSRYYALKTDITNPYTDVSKADWAYDYILSATANGWFIGYNDMTFKPNSSLTRAEAATTVNRVLNRKIELADIPDAQIMKYNDLSTNHWGYAAIMEATHTHKYTRKDNGFELWSDVIKPFALFND